MKSARATRASSGLKGHNGKAKAWVVPVVGNVTIEFSCSDCAVKHHIVITEAMLILADSNVRGKEVANLGRLCLGDSYAYSVLPGGATLPRSIAEAIQGALDAFNATACQPPLRDLRELLRGEP